jgi:hypothetical protein
MKGVNATMGKLHSFANKPSLLFVFLKKIQKIQLVSFEETAFTYSSLHPNYNIFQILKSCNRLLRFFLLNLTKVLKNGNNIFASHNNVFFKNTNKK